MAFSQRARRFAHNLVERLNTTRQVDQIHLESHSIFKKARIFQLRALKPKRDEQTFTVLMDIAGERYQIYTIQVATMDILLPTDSVNTQLFLHRQNLFLVDKMFHKSLLRLWILIQKKRIGTLLSSLTPRGKCQLIQPKSCKI